LWRVSIDAHRSRLGMIAGKVVGEHLKIRPPPVVLTLANLSSGTLRPHGVRLAGF
jgi:hypothetical protein